MTRVTLGTDGEGRWGAGVRAGAKAGRIGVMAAVLCAWAGAGHASGAEEGGGEVTRGTEGEDAGTAERARFDRLIADLDSSDFRVRDVASVELYRDARFTLKEAERYLTSSGALSPEQWMRLSKIAWTRFEEGPRGALGVSFASVLPGRLVIQQTIERFPCRKVLEIGDIITAIDGERIDVDARARERAVRAIVSHDPGDAIRLTVQRGKERVELAVTLGKYSELGGGGGVPSTSTQQGAWAMRSARYLASLKGGSGPEGSGGGAAGREGDVAGSESPRGMVIAAVMDGADAGVGELEDWEHMPRSDAVRPVAGGRSRLADRGEWTSISRVSDRAAEQVRMMDPATRIERRPGMRGGPSMPGSVSEELQVVSRLRESALRELAQYEERSASGVQDADPRSVLGREGPANAAEVVRMCDRVLEALESAMASVETEDAG